MAAQASVVHQTRDHISLIICIAGATVIFEECRKEARSGKDLRNPLVIQVESLAGCEEHTEDLLPPL